MSAFTDPELDAHLDETRRMNELIAAFMPSVPSFATAEGLAELRANEGFLAGDAVEGVVERSLPGPSGPIAARVHRGERIDAVYLDIHGGGWCIGSARNGDAANVELAARAGVAVVSIDYRLAPEHPWPAGADDCEAAALWLLEHGPAEFGTGTLLVGGSSAGAHLAAVTLLRLRDRHGPDALTHVVGANLVFGAYDLGLTPSQRRAEDGLVIPLATLEACYAHTFPGLDADARRDPAISPLYADLAGLPPALFTVGTADPLLDDSLFMAARWRAAGNEAQLHVYPEAAHGFPSFPIEIARIARARMAAFVASRLDLASPKRE